MFGFGVDELKGKSRRKPLVTARQIGMFVMRELTDLSYPAIAREFGGRDHTTVIHAVEKITALMKERQQIYDQVTELRQRIQSSALDVDQPVGEDRSSVDTTRVVPRGSLPFFRACGSLGTAPGQHDAH